MLTDIPLCNFFVYMTGHIYKAHTLGVQEQYPELHNYSPFAMRGVSHFGRTPIRFSHAGLDQGLAQYSAYLRCRQTQNIH